MKISRMGIRKQVLYLVLACSIVTLLVAGGITLIGMMNIKASAVNAGVEIGKAAADKSSQALKRATEESLGNLVKERSRQVNTDFYTIKWDVMAYTKIMETILNSPQNYATRYVPPPDRINEGIIVPQLQYDVGVNPATVAVEVGLTANVIDWLYLMKESDEAAASNYVASVDGFSITVDATSDLRVDENDNPLPSDYSSRPWYRKVLEEKKVTFTDVFEDAHGRGLVVSCVSPYHGEYGRITGIVGEDLLLADVSKIVLDTKFGDTGFGFVMDQKGRVIFSPKDTGVLAANIDENASLFLNESDPTLANAARLMAEGKTGFEYVTVDGVPCYIAFAPLEDNDWSFGVVVEESEILKTAEVSREIIGRSTSEFVGMLDSSIGMMMLGMFGAFIAIILIVPAIARRIADQFAKPINLLADGVREIASGNLDKKLDIHTGNEIEHLAVTFNAMTDELKNYMANLTKVTADKERIATELNVATNIQLSMLPKDFDFGRSDFEIFATMHAAKEVGGDFYDFYMLDDNHLVVTIADVSGKGVPAALFMAQSKTILKNFAITMTNPDEFGAVMTNANNQLCQGNEEMMFVTVFMAMIDLKTGRMLFVNGGHNPPMVYHKATDKFEYLEVNKNCVLGMMDDMDFEQQEIQLGHGDILYLYTDGVTEAMDPDNNQYGEERLSKCLNSVNKSAELEEILHDVREDLTDHVKDAAQSDDITMVAVRWV